MNNILILASEVAQKIAAGEVIERPLSAVKELVENSLDALTSEIRVELLEGGKKLIRVTDNGQGMSREDALICFERHSTSKIATIEDLGRIATLGFRGEALPSISAVSRVILKTSDGKEEKGTLIEREGEEVILISDVAFPIGTAVEVKDLFFNLPARKKFLRSEKSELTQVVKYMTFVSLVHPQKRFSLTHGKRQIFDYPPVKSLRERIFQVFGKSLLENLMEVDHEEEGRRINGYASAPPSGRRDRTHQLLFVNKRLVKDRTLQAAVNQAYRGFLEKDQYPEAFLFLFCPYEEVDVNVHPAKAEIRFKDSRPVFQLVLHSIEKAMLKQQGIKEVYPFREELKSGARVEERRDKPAFPADVKKPLEREGLFPRVEEKKRSPRVLGQYLDMYIIASTDEGILIIDQHNAHERVLFEKYQEIDRKKKWPQKLALFPVLFELSPSQVLSFEENQSLLEEIGFRVEAMSGRSYSLKEFPDLFEEMEAREILFSLLEEVKGEKIEDKKKRVMATLACKTAVKAGQVLPFEKMNYLVEELFKTSNASLCPHGRPIVVKIGRKEIERGLKRDGN
ncbi:MAG: DNA mismatch repair endonuclease MutL [Candidatus Aminicenantes bacterium]|nr:DNA mismatch repair endonuclease MutL [Candidatus Aminicenantes bacterium]MDH5704508.1 DNA mismatch repair endonuclease MutL [Candidatus Aminicenantes bacterium]